MPRLWPFFFSPHMKITYITKNLILTKCSLCSIIAYTEAINLLDYSAVVIPVTRADQEIDLRDSLYEPLNETDLKNWEACKAFFFFFYSLSFALLSSRAPRATSTQCSTLQDLKPRLSPPPPLLPLSKKKNFFLIQLIFHPA